MNAPIPELTGELADALQAADIDALRQQFIIDLQEIVDLRERISALTQERHRQVKVLRDALEEIMDRAEWLDPIAYEIASKALKEIE